MVFTTFDIEGSHAMGFERAYAEGVNDAVYIEM